MVEKTYGIARNLRRGARQFLYTLMCVVSLPFK